MRDLAILLGRLITTVARPMGNAKLKRLLADSLREKRHSRMFSENNGDVGAATQYRRISTAGLSNESAKGVSGWHG